MIKLLSLYFVIFGAATLAITFILPVYDAGTLYFLRIMGSALITVPILIEMYYFADALHDKYL